MRREVELGAFACLELREVLGSLLQALLLGWEQHSLLAPGLEEGGAGSRHAGGCHHVL